MVKKYIIKGLVQGIGYRPFVAKIADQLNIDGWVRNTGGIVTVMASGDEEALNTLKETLLHQIPTGGFITSIDEKKVDEAVDPGFKIVESDSDIQANLPLIPADICTCSECEKELLDPKNRRYRHPFISCTICGPRYSIIEKLPYDRDTITMGDFEMCDGCKAEYTGKTDRRRHAQTIACKKCGPKLTFKVISGDKYESPEDFLRAGGILAIKDIGGYHLACDPFNKDAVASLRMLKHREAKAFAIMFYDMNQVKEYCQVNDREEELLTGPARPIVLLRRKKDFADNVCLTSPDVGAMLPCNPVQILLSKALGPLIMTSGNASGDVLETDDAAMEAWLEDRAASEAMAGVSLGMLSHNRRILRPMDDSVMKVVRGRTQFIRRARGYVPNPIQVDLDGELFAAGGDLKSSFCYVKNGLAYVSQYLGDMESVSCQHFYKAEKAAMKRIFGFSPKEVAVDKHPGYFSRRANLQTKLPATEVQHHKAHVASVIAEHGLTGPVLGFAFDGTGYGDDGTIWGSEVFLYDGMSSMERVAHLQPMKLIGGNEGAKNCDTILTGFLHGNGIHMPKTTPESQLVMAALDNNINCVTSTSMGRLFDAASALLDICHYNSYEGQAPIELENIARTAEKGYLMTIGQEGNTKKLFLDMMEAFEKGVPKNEIAKGFIEAVADFICTTAELNSSYLDEKKQIVLSGGTFLNRLLLESTIDRLEAFGFNVYTAEQLPPGDGGICLGQAFILRNFVIK